MDAKKQKIYDVYLQHLSIKGLAKDTVKLYAKEAKAFLEFVDDVEYIDNAIVFKYLSKYSNMATASKNRYFSSLKVFTTHLFKNVYPSMNKIHIQYIRGSRKLPKILDQDEVLRRLGVVKKLSDMSNKWILKRNYAICIFLYATGMRVSELLKFNMNDIIDRAWVRITCGKGSKDRVVPVAKEAVIALEEYIKICSFPLDKGLFLNCDGKILNRVSVYNLLKKNMGVNPHSMRHHFATHMIINGADVSVVSELLGHSSFTTTQIYTHVKKPQLAETVNRCHPMAKEDIHAI